LCRRIVCASATAAVVLAASTSSASAADPFDTVAPCAGQTLEQPFTRWLDPASYTLAPDGAIEDGGSAWSLEGGARTADGNESFFIHDTSDQSSLSLPGGSRATTGAMCVTVGHPTVRLMAKRTGGSTLGSLRVDVLYQDALTGATVALPIGSVASGGSWAPSAPLPVVFNLLSPLSGGQAAVAFRFVPQLGSSWSIDDVYVDPYRNR
jgi:hypothetical protein